MRPLTAGIVDCVSKIYKEEGPAAFSKGLFPRMLVQAPLFGLTLLSYGTFAQVQVGLERGGASALFMHRKHRLSSFSPFSPLTASSCRGPEGVLQSNGVKPQRVDSIRESVIYSIRDSFVYESIFLSHFEYPTQGAAVRD